MTLIMHNKMKIFAKFLNFLILISGVTLALTPFILFPVCEGLKSDGSRMICFNSAILITISGALIALSALINFKFKNIFIALIALASFIIPVNNFFNFGLCGSLDHDCQAVMMPKAGMLIALIILISFINLILNFLSSERR